MNIFIWAVDGTLTDTITPGQSGTGGNKNAGVFQHSPKLQDWSLTIRWFGAISRRLIEWLGCCPSVEMQSAYFTAPPQPTLRVSLNRFLILLFCPPFFLSFYFLFLIFSLSLFPPLLSHSVYWHILNFFSPYLSLTTLLFFFFLFITFSFFLLSNYFPSFQNFSLVFFFPYSRNVFHFFFFSYFFSSHHTLSPYTHHQSINDIVWFYIFFSDPVVVCSPLKKSFWLDSPHSSVVEK